MFDHHLRLKRFTKLSLFDPFLGCSTPTPPSIAAVTTATVRTGAATTTTTTPVKCCGQTTRSWCASTYKREYRVLAKHPFASHQASFIHDSIFRGKNYILKISSSKQSQLFLKNGPTPASFLFIFGLFNQTIKFLQQICVKMSI